MKETLAIRELNALINLCVSLHFIWETIPIDSRYVSQSNLTSSLGIDNADELENTLGSFIEREINEKAIDPSANKKGRVAALADLAPLHGGAEDGDDLRVSRLPGVGETTGILERIGGQHV